MEFLLPYIQVMPESMDIVNPDEVGRYIFDVYSAPAKVLRSQKEVDNIRQARHQATQQANSQAQAAQAAQTLPHLAKGGEPGSPLDYIMNQMGQEGGQSGETPNMADATAPTPAERVI